MDPDNTLAISPSRRAEEFTKAMSNVFEAPSSHIYLMRNRLLELEWPRMADTDFDKYGLHLKLLVNHVGITIKAPVGL